MLKLLRGILVGVGLWVCGAGWAEVDPAYRVSFGILGEVQALAEAPDGQILVGGAIDQVGPIQRRHLVRLTAAGAVDPSFDVGAGFYAPSPSTLFRRLRVLADGTVFVAGDFRSLGNDPCDYAVIVSATGTFVRRFPQARPDQVRLNYFALENGQFLLSDAASPDLFPLTRLLADGSVDPTFSSTVKYVHAVAEYGDGRLLVVTQLGSSRTVRRVLANGASDPSFAEVSVTGEVFALALQPDGRILVGGDIPGGVFRMLSNGGIDEAFSTARGSGTGFSFTGVRALRVQASGHILAGGGFTSFSGVNLPGLVRLAPSGAPTATYFLPSGGSVRALGRTTGAVAGNFRQLLGTRTGSVARLATETSADPAFRPLVTQAQASGTASRLAGGGLLVSGNFVSVNGQEASTLVRLDAAGNLDPAFVVPESLGRIYRQVPLADGRTLIAGLANAAYVARLLPNGALDQTFAFPADLVPSVGVLAMAPGGEFAMPVTLPGGFNVRLARFQPDGSLDLLFPSVLLSGNFALSYARDGSRLYAFGPNFNAQIEPSSPSASGGVHTSGVAAFLPDGSIDPGFRAAVSGIGFLTEAPDGNLYLGGSQATMSNALPPSASRSKLARLTRLGRIDETFQFGPALLGAWDVACQAPGRIYLAADFQSASDSLSRLLPSGLPDAGFQSGLGDLNAVFSLLPQDDGGIVLATGGFNPLLLRRVRPETGPPVLLNGPPLVRRAAGRPVALGIGAGGALPMQSSWTRNGDPFTPVNDDLLAPAMTPELAGDYRVSLTNAQGSATSSLCRLELNQRPEISPLPNGVFSMQSGYRLSARTSDDTTPATSLRVTIDYRSASAYVPGPFSFALEAVPDALGNFTAQFPGQAQLYDPNPSLSVSVRVYDQDDGIATGTFQLEIRSECYLDWAGRHFTPAELGDAAVSGMNADLTGTGLTNLAAYYWDADPREASSPRRPSVQRLPDGSLEVIYYDLVPPAGSGQLVEFSTDLQTWTASPENVQVQVLATTPDGRRRRLSAVYVGPHAGTLVARFRQSTL